MDMIGTWKESEYSGQSVPVAGLAYLVTAPSRYCSPFLQLINLYFV